MRGPSMFLETGATWGSGGSTSRYRYTLWRHWDRTKGHVCWIMLNPSTADHTQDDPTIRRCMGFAETWGYGGIVVVNIFALRSTDPRRLRWVEDPIGPENDTAILAEASSAARVMAGWGVHARYLERHGRVLELLADLRVECLGLTKDGYPLHPLYVAGITKPRVLAMSGRRPVPGVEAPAESPQPSPRSRRAG